MTSMSILKPSGFCVSRSKSLGQRLVLQTPMLMGSSQSNLSNLLSLASAIPIAYANAHWRNYAGRCSETNGDPHKSCVP